VILRGAKPAEGWTFADRALAVASMLADELRCPGCGQLKAESWNPDSAGWYEAHEATCQGCDALERRRESDDQYEPEVKRWVVDTRPPDNPLKEWQPA
jgi:hypothetical protein